MSFRIPVLEYYEWQKPVLDKDLSAPPSNPSKGDRYIIAYNPSGAWHNKPKRIAEYNGLAWDLFEMREGMLTLVKDEGLLYQYVNDKWRDFALIIGRRRVEPQNSSKVITLDDCGKVYTCDTTSMCTYTLPSVGYADIGVHFTFIRLNPQGSLVVQAADLDIIADSGPGGTIYSSDIEESNTSLSILLAGVDKWVITGGHGTWTVTD